MRVSHRSRAGRFTRTSRRRVGAARRSNPTRRRHHSEAMKAKISRAVKAAMRRRSSGGGAARRTRRTHHRSVVRHVARRHSYSPVRRSNRIVMGRLLNPRRRRRSRGIRRYNPAGGLASIRGMLSKDTVMVAAGAITASVATGYVLNRFGGTLPLMNTKYGPIVYQIAIPMAGAYLLRKKYRAFSEGLVVGGVVMAITTVMKSGMLGASASTLVQGPMGNFYEVKGMGLAGEIGRGAGVRGMRTYINPRTLNTVPQAVNSPAFAPSAW